MPTTDYSVQAASAGIDLFFRPASYWKPTTVGEQTVSRITGHVRRTLAQEWLDNTGAIPPELLRPLDDTRHGPALLGGEYLGELDGGEVEIARVSLDSVTADQVSVRVRRDGKKIRYSVEEEYDGETLDARWGPRSSKEPLTLAQLVKLIDSAVNVFSILRDNSDGLDFDSAQSFVAVSSAFYPELRELYARRVRAWAPQRYTPDEAENDDADSGDNHDEEVEP